MPVHAHCLCDSVETHVCDFGGVPAGHLESTSFGKQIAGASFEHHTLFFALVEQLLLSSSQCSDIGFDWDVVTFLNGVCLRTSVELIVGLSVLDLWVKGRPRWHQELQLVSVNIDDTVFVLHQMFQARRCVENPRDTDWCTHKSEERHFSLINN